MDSDLELLQRWRAGEKSAGNELFKRYFDRMWRFFATKVDRDIDELVQATFLSCIKGRDSFRQQSSFRTYLYTIARNELYGYLRRRRRHAEALDFGVTSLADLGTTPRSRVAKDQEYQLLLRALHQLPVEQQTLLELHYWDDMSPSQLAEIFDMPPSSMRTRLHRARKALREIMNRLAKEPGARHESDESLESWARSLRFKWSNQKPGDGE